MTEWINGSTLIGFVCGYLCGAIPFGLILTRLGGYGDLRTFGSGNIGATNVLRTGSKWLALGTLFFDMLKAIIPILIIRYFLGETAALFCAFGAFLGHLFPIWLNFKGGKGAATLIGILLVILPIAALIFCFVWLVMAFLYRYSSVSSLISTLVVALFTLFTQNFMMTILIFAMAALLVFKHRGNISRLLKGTESKISFSAKIKK